MLFRSDRKSTRLNSSHTIISYAVFCLKKKKTKKKALEHSHAVARPHEDVLGVRAWPPRGALPRAPDALGRCGGRGLSFFFNDTATTEIYTLSLHDALPI